MFASCALFEGLIKHFQTILLHIIHCLASVAKNLLSCWRGTLILLCFTTPIITKMRVTVSWSFFNFIRFYLSLIITSRKKIPQYKQERAEQMKVFLYIYLVQVDCGWFTSTGTSFFSSSSFFVFPNAIKLWLGKWIYVPNIKRASECCLQEGRKSRIVEKKFLLIFLLLVYEKFLFCHFNSSHELNNFYIISSNTLLSTDNR